MRADVTVDEVYLLIRSLAQTSAVAPPTAAALDAAIDIVCRGLRR